jgi:hypothetical protein
VSIITAFHSELKEGSYAFPFSFEIPLDCPTSTHFEDDEVDADTKSVNASIKYFIKAKLSSQQEQDSECVQSTKLFNVRAAA